MEWRMHTDDLVAFDAEVGRSGYCTIRMGESGLTDRNSLSTDGPRSCHYEILGSDANKLQRYGGRRRWW